MWYVYVVESMNNYPHDWRLQTRPSFSLRRDLSLLIIVLFISLDLSILYSTMLNRSDYTKQSVGGTVLVTVKWTQWENKEVDREGGQHAGGERSYNDHFTCLVMYNCFDKSILPVMHNLWFTAHTQETFCRDFFYFRN